MKTRTIEQDVRKAAELAMASMIKAAFSRELEDKLRESATSMIKEPRCQQMIAEIVAEQTEQLAKKLET